MMRCGHWGNKININGKTFCLMTCGSFSIIISIIGLSSERWIGGLALTPHWLSQMARFFLAGASYPLTTLRHRLERWRIFPGKIF